MEGLKAKSGRGTGQEASFLRLYPQTDNTLEREVPMLGVDRCYHDLEKILEDLQHLSTLYRRTILGDCMPFSALRVSTTSLDEATSWR